jgi:hypothetical protein
VLKKFFMKVNQTMYGTPKWTAITGVAKRCALVAYKMPQQPANIKPLAVKLPTLAFMRRGVAKIKSWCERQPLEPHTR